MLSLIIPVYKNEESIAELLGVLAKLAQEVNDKLEVVFVVDCSPDNSYMLLREGLQHAPYRSKLLLLSKNFGSFAAIRAG